MNAPARSVAFKPTEFSTEEVSAPEAPAPDRLSIVHVVRQFYPNRGGLEDVVASLAREQIRAGYDVRVVTLDRLFVKPDEVLPERAALGEIPIERIPFRGSSRYPIAPKVFGRLGGADIVHVHGVDFFYDALALTKPFHRKALVATTHGGFFHTKDFSGLKKLWFNGPTRLTSAFYDAIVGVSPGDAANFEPFAPSRTSAIENGADLDKFAGCSSPRVVKRMVTLGRFSKNKHPERLIAALKELVARDPDWRLDIVGAESDWTAAMLKAEIATAGVERFVTLHVGLENTAVAQIMRGASLFVSASDYEGFGVALIEAMSAGLAPIVHPNTAFVGLANRHSAVRLVDFADPAAAATAIVEKHAQLAADPIAARASAAELDQYAWPQVAENYMRVYRAALRRHEEVA